MLRPNPQIPELTTSERHIRDIGDKVDGVYYWLKGHQSAEFEPLVAELGDAKELLRGLQREIDAERGADQERVFQSLKGGA